LQPNCSATFSKFTWLKNRFFVHASTADAVFYPPASYLLQSYPYLGPSCLLCSLAAYLLGIQAFHHDAQFYLYVAGLIIFYCDALQLLIVFNAPLSSRKNFVGHGGAIKHLFGERQHLLYPNLAIPLK